MRSPRGSWSKGFSTQTRPQGVPTILFPSGLQGGDGQLDGGVEDIGGQGGLVRREPRAQDPGCDIAPSHMSRKHVIRHSFLERDFLVVSIIGPQVSTQSVVFLDVQERSEDHACYAVRR